MFDVITCPISHTPICACVCNYLHVCVYVCIITHLFARECSMHVFSCARMQYAFHTGHWLRTPKCALHSHTFLHYDLVVTEHQKALADIICSLSMQLQVLRQVHLLHAHSNKLSIFTRHNIKLADSNNHLSVQLLHIHLGSVS